jgi:tRNA(fMet)-specific endonuclease VapC
VGLILDSSVLIAAERGLLDLPAFLETHSAEPVAMAAITASELLHGYHRAKDAGPRARRAAFVEALLALIPVLPFGMREARQHAELWAALMRKGNVIGPHDLLIAATALAHGDTLATLNRKEFSKVGGLQLARLERYLAR